MSIGGENRIVSANAVASALGETALGHADVNDPGVAALVVGSSFGDSVDIPVAVLDTAESGDVFGASAPHPADSITISIARTPDVRGDHRVRMRSCWHTQVARRALCVRSEHSHRRLLPVPGADYVGDVAGDVGTKFLNAAWGEVKQIPGAEITEAFGSNAEAARAAEISEAYLGRERLAISTYLALAEAGIVPEPIGQWVAPDGGLIDLDDISPEQMAYFREEATNLLTGYVSEAELNGAYKDPFLDFY